MSLDYEQTSTSLIGSKIIFSFFWKKKTYFIGTSGIKIMKINPDNILDFLFYLKCGNDFKNHLRNWRFNPFTVVGVTQLLPNIYTLLPNDWLDNEKNSKKTTNIPIMVK